MLVEKEIIGPGTYWYVDEKTRLPRKLDVTPELTKYWGDQGNEMISLGLPIPVPYEHDFDQHPMTPKEKLLNNAGEVKEYRLKKDVLFGVVDVQDDEVKKKIGKSIRWTSPWINSFTDGSGRQWSNVISHLALTTHPRITKQASFPSIAAALSLASPTENKIDAPVVSGGYCLSQAGKLVQNKQTKRVRPLYPMAFSLLSGGVKFGEDDDVKPLKKKEKSEGGDKGGSDSKPKPKSKPGSDSSSSGSKPPPKPKEGGDKGSDASEDEYEGGGDEFSFDDDSDDSEGDDNPFGGDSLGDQHGDVRMEEILCDLLNALGIYMPENVGETEFKRSLYEAAMGKIRELTSKAQAATDPNNPNNSQAPTAPKPLGAGAGTGTGQPNPILQQEQQPMYMSLEEINKLPEPTRGVALAMHAENVKLRSEGEARDKIVNSLRDAKLKEATTARDSRILLLGKRSPSARADLETMKALPSMALSMGDGGEVIDPMASTLALLEKGLADIPTLLKTDVAALSVQSHPTDGEMSEEEMNKIAANYARMMGAIPEVKAS